MPFSLRNLVFAFTLSMLSVIAQAGPWVDVGDVRVRNNLALLNDSGVISISLTTWPVMWADVKKSIKGIDTQRLTLAQRSALRELRHELKYNTSNKMRRSIELVASNSRALFRDFGSFQREKGEIHKSLDWMGENVAFRLNANVMSEPGEELVETDFYGSYLASVIGGQDGNWLVGAGAIDRWWGPGYQSSLILSNNARPVPAFFLRTKHGQRFETPLLSWLGEWQFVSFIGQLESNRAIPEAKLTGMRFTFMPLDGLEIGMSRAMQWGGEGRSEGIKTFWKSLTSQGENEAGDSGNQLAGFDVRYGFEAGENYSASVYAQTIGEDEAGYMPARRTYQFGAHVNHELSSGDHLRYFLEYVNTTADAFSDEFSNMTYEHHIYQSGYRYRGRALGASYDNDAEVVSFELGYQAQSGSLSSIGISAMKLNEDGVARGNVVSPVNQSLVSINLKYQFLILGGMAKLGVVLFDEKQVSSLVESDKVRLRASWIYRY